MKRSYINLITVLLIFVECVFTFLSLNEKYVYINSTLQDKYVILMIIFYMGSVIASGIYWVGFHPSIEYKRSMKEHYEKVFKFQSFNCIYTYHFLAFTIISFALNDWPWVIMGLALFVLWNYVRVKQNTYAEEYNLEVAKQNARHKPTVVLDD